LKITQTLYVTNREDWRTWLAQHHAHESEIWLILYKKETGQPSIPYDDAVEEALCFGWIDSIIQKIDDEKYAQKYTPRKNNAKWSDSNKKRLKKLLNSGKMTPAGMAKIDAGVLQELENYDPDKKPKELPVPPFFEAALQEHPAAWENFKNLAPTYRRQFIGWVSEAKREETRAKRIQKSIDLLLANKNLTQM
jgi:uncharacterized protein YdeI (YjbR/CyaY-like superfamily)